MTVDGFAIIPFMGLTSWVAFRRGALHTTLMGDIVLLEDEVSGATSAAVNSGLYVAALHNHFIREQPSVLFMHIEGTTAEATLGRAVREVFDAIAVPWYAVGADRDDHGVDAPTTIIFWVSLNHRKEQPRRLWSIEAK